MFDRREVLTALKKPSDRDRQRLVGPSNLSNACSYCLAKDMLGVPEGNKRYWVGAKFGSMIHAGMEELFRERGLVEQRVTVGEIPGYGVITGSCDLFVDNTVVDWKTTTREKLTFYRRAEADEPDDTELSKITEARATLARYFFQTNLYGLGMENAGHTVERVSVVFLCRDGKTDDDIWSASRPYDRDVALKVLDRASRLWEYLQEGNDIEALTSHPACYPCGVEGRV